MDFLEKMRAHFAAEKNESLLFILIGLTTLATAAFCWLVWRRPFYQGMAWPLALIALVQLVAGAKIYFGVDKWVAFFTEKYTSNPAIFKKNAMVRMKTVLRNLVIYRWAEVGVAVIGFVLILYHQKSDFWKGCGAGMFLQGGLMLVAEFFAEKRAKDYQAALREIPG